MRRASWDCGNKIGPLVSKTRVSGGHGWPTTGSIYRSVPVEIPPQPNPSDSDEKREIGAAAMGGGTTYKAHTIPHNKLWHTVSGKGLCAVMWFWVFYRAKQDGAVLLGLRHPWDGHDDHSHGHGHEHEGSSSSSSH